MRGFWRHISALAFLTLVLPGLAHACDCGAPRPGPCGLLKRSAAIFIGTVFNVENPDPDPMKTHMGVARYTFAVTETFAGSSAGEVVVYSSWGDCGYNFKKGEQYLVYAYAGHDNSLSVQVCNRTQLAAGAGDLIRQLRAARDGKPVASLFGVLQRTQQPHTGTWIEDYEQPIPNTTVRLRSKTGKVFTAKTGDSGDYAFYRLPQGIYEVSADLPPALGIAQTLLPDPPPPLRLPAGSCYQYNLDAMPRSQIKGHLIGPDGKDLQGGVELFADDLYSQASGWWEYSREKGFVFDHVAPGNYILVFNNSNRPNANAPYPRTFYPGTADFARASRIHVSEDQLEVDADIHLAEGEETTEVTVKLEWSGNSQGKREPAFVLVHSDAGDSPYALQLSNGMFSLRLLKRANYTVQGVGYCQPNHRVETNTLPLNGAGIFTGPITLRFPENACAH